MSSDWTYIYLNVKEQVEGHASTTDKIKCINGCKLYFINQFCKAELDLNSTICFSVRKCVKRLKLIKDTNLQYIRGS